MQQRLQQFQDAVRSHQGGGGSSFNPGQSRPFSSYMEGERGGGGTATIADVRLQSIPWTQIQQPGCWVDASTGDLIRIPPQAISQGGNMPMPLLEIETTRLAARFFHLSPDAFIPTHEARQLIEQLQQVLARNPQRAV